MTGFRKLLNSAAAYTIANVINSAIPFFLLPVLTRVLSPAEYGMVTMFTTVMSVLSAFTGLSVHGAVSVRYFDKKTDHPLFVGTCLALLAGSTVLVLIAMLFFATYLERFTQVPKLWLILAVLGSSMYFVIQVRLVIWQVQGQPARFGVFQIAQTTLNLALSLGLILMLGMGWEGRLIGLMFALVFFGIVALVSLRHSRLIEWKFSSAYAREALRFGVPLIPHTIGGILIALSDKFVITAKLGLSVTGTYAVGAQLGMVVGVIASSFVQAYSPHLYKQLGENEPGIGQRLVKLSFVIFLGFILLAITYSAILPYIYSLFIGANFQNSMNIAILLAFGNAIEGMYFTIAGFLFFMEKTAALAKLTIVCGIFNLPLTYLLVSQAGIIGAAWSFVLVQGAFFIGAWYLAQRYYPLPWISVLSSLSAKYSK
jgi:O-antigen/teichoic acid export membrane protein